MVAHEPHCGAPHRLDSGSAQLDFAFTYPIPRGICPLAAVVQNKLTSMFPIGEGDLPFTRADPAAWLSMRNAHVWCMVLPRSRAMNAINAAADSSDR